MGKTLLTRLLYPLAFLSAVLSFQLPAVSSHHARALGDHLYAVVIGVSDYPDASGFSKLQYAERDAWAMNAVLKRFGYQSRPLVGLHATTENIKQALQQLRQELLVAAEADAAPVSVIFYFSGHGFSFGPDKTSYLVTYDTDRLQAPDTGLRLDQVLRMLRTSGADRVVYLIDACRDRLDAGTKGQSGRITQFFPTRNFGDYGLYAAAPGEVSFEEVIEDQGLRTGRGVFTHFLLQGLRGEADVDGDLGISFQELAEYVHDKTEAYSQKQRRNQEPVFELSASGDILLTIIRDKRDVRGISEPSSRPEPSWISNDIVRMAQRMGDRYGPGHVKFERSGNFGKCKMGYESKEGPTPGMHDPGNRLVSQRSLTDGEDGSSLAIEISFHVECFMREEFLRDPGVRSEYSQ